MASSQKAKPGAAGNVTLAALRAGARKSQAALAEFHGTAARYIQNAPPLPAERFWAILAAYRKYILAALAGKNAAIAERDAADSLMRLVMVGPMFSHDSKVFQKGQWREAASFVRQYDALGESLGAAFDAADADLGRGDDGFSDLCDALPLAGEDVCRDVLAGRILTDAQLEHRVVEAANTAQWPAGVQPAGLFPKKYTLAESILHGEGYHEMGLRQALMRYLRNGLGGPGGDDDCDD